MIALLIAFVFGIFASWLLRNLAARAEGRVGPPLLQPVWDLIKLFSKGSVGDVSEALPLLSLLLVAFAVINLPSPSNWGGNLIVVLYSLTASSIFTAIAGFASSSPFSRVGGSRELQQTLLSELLFLAAGFSAVVAANSTSFQAIALHNHLLLFINFLMMLIACQAKLRKAPFDIPDANVEVAGGPATEFSGYALGMHELTYLLELYCLPMLASFLFLGLDYTASLLASLLVILVFGGIAALSARFSVKNSNKLLFFAFLLSMLITTILYIGGRFNGTFI
ncbi:MAG: NADH-quinone oxidoreductase subunit H [Candidatus Micrarchaeia archaeon]